MEKIAILTDSTSDLDKETIDRYGIEVLPLKVIYRDRVYDDRVDIAPQEVYDRLSEEVPTTSTPSPREAENAFAHLQERGFSHVLAVHISGGLSATVETVRLAAERFSGLKTAVIDSKSLSMGLGFVARQAARWVEKKVGFDTLVGRTQAMVERSKAFYVLKTLEYLRRGGRIGAVSAAVAGALQLKPIISIDEDGRYYSYRRVRGRRQSVRELFETAKAAVETGLDTVAVVHGDAEEEAGELHADLRRLPGVKEAVFGQVSPVMVVHTGPGLIGVALTRA